MHEFSFADMEVEGEMSILEDSRLYVGLVRLVGVERLMFLLKRPKI